MIRQTLAQLESMMETTLIQAEDKEKMVEGVCIDSRQVKENMLYVPLKGARVDGHTFIGQVKDKKAAASLWQRDQLPYPAGIPLFLVDDVLQALQQLGAAWQKKVSPFTIGITGSNGKTSTKDMTASIYATRYRTWKTQGNHNNEIGLPLTQLEMDEDTEVLILEMGMENFHEISFLCSLAPLNQAMVVSIGSAHMENLGSKENIAKAKCEIIEGLRTQGTFIYNEESSELRTVLSQMQIPASIETIPFGAGTEICITGDIHYDRDEMVFGVSCLSRPVRMHAVGKHMAQNALAAIASALAAGFKEDEILEGLQKMELTKMRSRLFPSKKALILDDSYKSNPESAKAGLEALMQVPAAIHLAVLADMLDLGEQEANLHREIGVLAKDLGVDILYTWGPLSQHTAEGFGENATHFETKEQLMEELLPWLEKDTAILVKGSRAMAMDSIVSALLEGTNQDE